MFINNARFLKRVTTHSYPISENFLLFRLFRKTIFNIFLSVCRVNVYSAFVTNCSATGTNSVPRVLLRTTELDGNTKVRTLNEGSALVETRDVRSPSTLEIPFRYRHAIRAMISSFVPQLKITRN